MSVAEDDHVETGAWAWRLPGAMRAAGLVEVGGEVRAAIGDRGFTECMRLTVLRLRERIVAAGVAAVEVDRCLEMLGDPGCSVTAAPAVSVWGRRQPPGRELVGSLPRP